MLRTVDGWYDVRSKGGRRQIDHGLAVLAQHGVMVLVGSSRSCIEDQLIEGNSGIATSPSIPRAVVGTPRRAARCSPGDSGSIPTKAPISSTFERRITLIIKSVPIFPEPMIATFDLCMGQPPAK